MQRSRIHWRDVQRPQQVDEEHCCWRAHACYRSCHHSCESEYGHHVRAHGSNASGSASDSSSPRGGWREPACFSVRLSLVCAVVWMCAPGVLEQSRSSFSLLEKIVVERDIAPLAMEAELELAAFVSSALFAGGCVMVCARRTCTVRRAGATDNTFAGGG